MPFRTAARAMRPCPLPSCVALMLLVLAAFPAWAVDIPVDVLGDPAPNGCTTGDCSLREAVTPREQSRRPDACCCRATPGLPLQL